MAIINTIKDFILPIVAFVISIISLGISKKSELLSKGEIEFHMATLIRDAQYRVSDKGIDLAKYRSTFLKSLENNPQMSQEDLEKALENDLEYNVLMISFNQSVEIMLNAYEESCAKYLDKKVDSERFKRSYHKAIRDVVENQEFKENFNSHTTPYKCILKVYNKWYNLEK